MITNTRRQRILMLWLVVLAFTALFITPVAFPGQRKQNRLNVLKPIRAQGRANAGYPGWQTLKNTTAIGANVTATVANLSGWPAAMTIGVVRFIVTPH